MIAINNKKEDYIDDDNYFEREDQPQGLINKLRKNLTEKSIYTQLFNICYTFEEVMEKNKKDEEEIKKQDNNKKKETKNDINEKEQIDEVKVNMYMILHNECDIRDSHKKDFYYIDNKDIKMKRLIIEDCIIENQSLIIKRTKLKMI